MSSLARQDNSLVEDATESATVLRWVFRRGWKALTCEVRASGRDSYDVCVVPHWDVSSSVVEPFDRSLNALRRHAELARYFQEAGWVQSWAD